MFPPEGSRGRRSFRTGTLRENARSFSDRLCFRQPGRHLQHYGRDLLGQEGPGCCRSGPRLSEFCLVICGLMAVFFMVLNPGRGSGP